MSHQIKNSSIELIIDLPNERYKGSRFDWTSKLTEVRFHGLKLTATEVLNSADEDDFGRGFYNEFGIESALGYQETNQGEWFHKIGVGLLKKRTGQYAFHQDYEIRPCDFMIHTDRNRIQVDCKSELINGYAYLYQKEIVALEDGFVIKYHLENTGLKDILTDEYNHNFLSFDNELIGKDYCLKFPFHLTKDRFDEYVNPDDVVKVGASKIGFLDQPKDAFFFSNISGRNIVNASWKLENPNLNIGIKESGDFQTKKINLWGCGHVISPELFFNINIKPGQSVKWSRRYDLYHLDK